MIAAKREVDRDWSEFESYATNLYVRSLIINRPLSTSTIEPPKLRQEQQSIPDPTNHNIKVQSTATHLNIKTIIDEIASLRKAILDLRIYSEEVRLNRKISIEIIVFFCC